MIMAHLIGDAQRIVGGGELVPHSSVGETVIVSKPANTTWQHAHRSRETPSTMFMSKQDVPSCPAARSRIKD